MASVLVLMMQKDEGPLLFKWFNHYSRLFNIKNLTVMDNGSTDKYTLKVLKHFESLGAKIRWEYTSYHDFDKKGGHFQNIIKSWDAERDYDFALPVDCDEFLGVFTDHRVSVDTADIMMELDSLKHVQCALRIDTSLFNVPGDPGWFSPIRHFHKGFLPANSILRLDNGQHAPVSRLKDGHVSTRLTYLHWHNRSLPDLKAATVRKLEGRVDVNNPVALEEYGRNPSLPGNHLVVNLSLTAKMYKLIYNKELCISVPDLAIDATELRENKIKSTWSATDYLANNPDVQKYALGPLHHYVRTGWKEKRAISKQVA
ncbi:hypothetical protein HN018_00120 [Lichenicola cladoniae]|uniref:Uncharacterized protein n=1 Tax=Lichenicola cladoniae TaxID=1484109 RepID=A0A6M8HH89_9PROT|nr:glycosyltransferase family 2 protein [Lichenicola cladoniae]NPD66720.1 hypothetical protein [Acetobacteraceae bacterium]QKE88669.1 hypothetical protein HN018_00120 [Lichenicola cladoniae]